jgi:hypothetical protein
LHPFQDQINRMQDLIKLRIRAQRNGYWLETIDLSYILLEIELRILLSSKVIPKKLAIQEIVGNQFLSSLADTAKDKGYIDEKLWKRIKDFNKIRRNAIHGLAQGRIAYSDLEKPCRDVLAMIGEIQNLFLPITFGEIETTDGS